jgi:hypothetical protein
VDVLPFLDVLLFSADPNVSSVDLLTFFNTGAFLVDLPLFFDRDVFSFALLVLVESTLAFFAWFADGSDSSSEETIGPSAAFLAATLARRSCFLVSYTASRACRIRSLSLRGFLPMASPSTPVRNATFVFLHSPWHKHLNGISSLSIAFFYLWTFVPMSVDSQSHHLSSPFALVLHRRWPYGAGWMGHPSSSFAQFHHLSTTWVYMGSCDFKVNDQILSHL